MFILNFLHSEMWWYISLVPVVFAWIHVTFASPNNLGYNQKLTDFVTTYLKFTISFIILDLVANKFFSTGIYTLQAGQVLFLLFIIIKAIQIKVRKNG